MTVLAILTLLVVLASLTPSAAIPSSDADAFPVLSDSDDDEAGSVRSHSPAAIPAPPAPLRSVQTFETPVSGTAARLADPGPSPRRCPRAPPIA
jgi:hypothetical protein